MVCVIEGLGVKYVDESMNKWTNKGPIKGLVRHLLRIVQECVRCGVLEVQGSRAAVASSMLACMASITVAVAVTYIYAK
ncbi:hypothetical protein HAX54_049920, partial [Datura stramonium]|nr:hypothetical protein [Datura stramonium]